MTLETRSPDPGEVTGHLTLLLIEGSAEDAAAIKAAIESGGADLNIETVEHISEGLERSFAGCDVALLICRRLGMPGPTTCSRFWKQPVICPLLHSPPAMTKVSD
jgi:hypothetical protein